MGRFQLTASSFQTTTAQDQILAAATSTHGSRNVMRPRSGATLATTTTTCVGTATTVYPSSPGGVLQQQLLALTMAPAPSPALSLTTRIVTAPRSLATLAWTLRVAGTGTTALARSTNGMVVMVSAL